MTSADFTFIEYSFDPLQYDSADIEQQLLSIGFVNRIVHVNHKVTLWTQGSAIIMLRETGEVDYPRITGIGLSVTHDQINDLSPDYDHDVDLHFVMDGNGMRVLLLTEPLDNNNAIFGGNYRVIDRSVNTTGKAEYISSLFMGNTNSRQMDFYQSLGFKFVKSDDRFNILNSNDNRFSIVFDKESDSNEPAGMLLETEDIFGMQTAFVINDLHILNFNDHVTDLGSLTHKVNGYNCYAYGNKNSYSIETMVVEPIPNVDIAVRYRKQFLGFKGDSLNRYYDKR